MTSIGSHRNTMKYLCQTQQLSGFDLLSHAITTCRKAFFHEKQDKKNIALK